jgi:HlyD family secretion protein
MTQTPSTPKTDQRNDPKTDPKTDHNGHVPNMATSNDEDSKAPSPKRRRFRKALYLLGGLGVVGAGILIFRPAPIQVDLATLERQAMEVTIEEEGQTRVRDRYVITAPVEGRLQRVELEEGDWVDAGQIIARLDPLPYNAEVRSLQAQIREMQAERAGVETRRPKEEALAEAEARIQAAIATQQEAEAQVAEARAALEQAVRDRQRAETLFEEGAVPRQALDDAQLEETVQAQTLEAAQRSVDRAAASVAEARETLQRLRAEQSDPDYLLDVYDARIRSLEADLASLADDAQRTEIRAPQSGQVLRVEQESTRFVAAGTPILEVGNAEQLELVVDVLSSDAVKINPGDPVRIDDWGGETPLNGQVSKVEPSAFTDVSALGVDEQRVNVIVDLQDPPPSLGDGFRTEAQIIIWDDPDVLTVPIGALFRCDEDWCVFRVENQRTQRHPIQIGHRNPSTAEVTDGLTEGDVVVMYPSELIEEGSRVRSR